MEGPDGDMILVNKNKDGELPGDSRKLPLCHRVGVSRQLPKVKIDGVFVPR